MKQIEMTGRTINEAIDNACSKLGVGLLDVEYKVIDEPTKGFLGIGAKPAKVLVTVIGSENDIEEIKSESTKTNHTEIKPEPKKEEVKAIEIVEIEKENGTVEIKTEEVVEITGDVSAADDENAENESARTGLTDEDKEQILSVATNFLKEVFEKMNMQVELSARFNDNKHIFVEINGEDMGTIIGKRGQTLDSIQYLTNLVVNKGEYPYMNVTLDTEDYRAKRQKTLEQLAFNLAKKAKHNRRNITLEPMNPYERRIIHATLQNDRYVTTYSEGTEPYRYVVIALKNNYSNRRNYN